MSGSTNAGGRSGRDAPMPASHHTAGRAIRAILLDFGDTLSREASQTRDERGVLASIDLAPGARPLVLGLRQRGYPLGLVVDGEAEDLYNVLEQHDLRRLFDAIAVSELVGAQKPEPAPYRRALDELGVDPADYGRVLMAGNRLERDVRGARELGLISVWANWSARYRGEPSEAAEVPSHAVREPLELLDLVDRLEAEAAGDPASSGDRAAMTSADLVASPDRRPTRRRR